MKNKNTLIGKKKKYPINYKIISANTSKKKYNESN